MPKMIFRGAIIRFFDWRRNDNGGQFVRIHFSADFTDPIRESMEWGEVQEGAKRTSLEGTVTATNLILTPNGRELKTSEIQLTAQEIRDFVFVRGKANEKTGKSRPDRMDFIVTCAQNGAAAIIEEYGNVIGKGAAQLRVGYEEQSELEMEEEDSEDEKGATLARAGAVGGTHQRKRKGKEDEVVQ